MKFFRWFLGIFLPYVSHFEHKVDKFFRNVKSTDSIAAIRGELLDLMRENLVVVNLWLEKKYKGYKYLKKAVRKDMYEGAEKIFAELEDFIRKNPVDIAEMKAALEEKNLSFRDMDLEKLMYLYAIMKFLSPGLYYHYIKTASFGKLLRDPKSEKLEGDCNQIVTLYAFLYGKKFPLEDLQIKLLPGHVCLHFKGIDIEATAGLFMKYVENKDVLPITEIVSTNLLDLADFREELQSISARDLLKSAQLAYAISSMKELVKRNLQIAYRNVGIAALHSYNFDSAIFFFGKLGDQQLILDTYKQAAAYFGEKQNFEKARFYAEKSGDKKYLDSLRYNEGVSFYKNANYEKALTIFSSLDDAKMQKACYAQMYHRLAERVAGVKNLEDAKKYKNVYREMFSLASKMQNSSLEESLRDTLNKL